jgi:hypothetical protein
MIMIMISIIAYPGLRAEFTSHQGWPSVAPVGPGGAVQLHGGKNESKKRKRMSVHCRTELFKILVDDRNVLNAKLA